MACSLNFRENNITASPVSVRIYCHRTTNCSEIATGGIIICVLTDSVLRFPLGVCLYRYGWSSHWPYRFTSIGAVLIAARARKCVYIDFNRIGIVTGRLSLPYCYFLLFIIIFVLSWYKLVQNTNKKQPSSRYNYSFNATLSTKKM